MIQLNWQLGKCSLLLLLWFNGYPYVWLLSLGDDDGHLKICKQFLPYRHTRHDRMLNVYEWDFLSFVGRFCFIWMLLLLLIVHNDGFTLFHGVFVFFMWVQFNLVFIFLIFSFSTASVGNFICLNSVNDACVCFCDIFTVMVGWLTVWLSGSIWFSFLVFNSI